MCESDTFGGGTANPRSAVASASGSWAASLRSAFGASGAGPRRKKRLALLREALAQPDGRFLHAAVLGEPPRQLLGGLLGVELGELGALLREQLPCLDLEQRGDQHEKLAAGLEIDLVTCRQVLDEGDDDLRDVDLGGLELILEDQRQEQVERSLERVEVQLEVANRRRHTRRI